MAQKKHTPEDIIGKLREAEIVQAQGRTAADIRCSDHPFCTRVYCAHASPDQRRTSSSPLSVHQLISE